MAMAGCGLSSPGNHLLRSCAVARVAGRAVDSQVSEIASAAIVLGPGAVVPSQAHGVRRAHVNRGGRSCAVAKERDAPALHRGARVAHGQHIAANTNRPGVRI